MKKKGNAKLKGRRVYSRPKYLGLSSDQYDMNLALTIVRSEPLLTIVRMVEKGGKTIIEISGEQQDLAQFRGTYNTRLMENLSRLYPDMSYDEKKSRMI